MAAKPPHCLVVPYPAQGHISPILQLSKRLIPKGITITLAFTKFISSTITPTTTASAAIRLASISDGYDAGGIHSAENIKLYMDRFREVGTLSLAELIQKQSDAGDPVRCVVYDSLLPWCLDVAKGFGIMAAPFMTQSCAVDTVYCHVRDQGLLATADVERRMVLTGLPGMLPAMKTGELPSFAADSSGYPGILEMFVDQFSNLHEADWVLCNSVYELEPESADWLTNKWPNFITIGPSIPSKYLHKATQSEHQDDIDYGFSIFKPINEPCLTWLQTKPPKSVVYVSFGSIANLSHHQMLELGHGLSRTNHHFLWVVRESELAKIPRDSLPSLGEKGLVLSWCPQLLVLASEAVGCFVTHCGWNSTLEAMSLGVPMVGMPQWSDQTTNAKYLEEVWGVALRAEMGGDGVVSRGEVERCVKEVMDDGVKGEEIRRNCVRFGELMKDVVSDGGSSRRNFDRCATSLI
ncbi:UDP-glycosyltransferase 74E2 [Linum grandiflorum]